MSGPLSHRRPGINVGSILLTPQENEVLSNHLGRKCTSLCSAVVQVYGADRNSSWVKKCCGVACLVKDNSQRSYFIRVIDMKDGKQLFDQELYNNFSINYSRPYFITFAGDVSTQILYLHAFCVFQTIMLYACTSADRKVCAIMDTDTDKVGVKINPSNAGREKQEQPDRTQCRGRLHAFRDDVLHHLFVSAD
ncbi:neural Wiskott-Aldrich syndrome protein-like [Sinocyclocheilus rhinocerous]|uniref:neural Wiskott-Aldrich syndrome protein-like n=1 Tax=Sinocyclocheilus rhinocerous TaxID=307959 RepID=UPI0007B7D37D|nr:PREDICTED: neural Wiskott-Aldrich syndrome protein-like [Sinocyclocheilus rhinocerous]